jgi:Tfp pilus assembly protein PilV
MKRLRTNQDGRRAGGACGGGACGGGGGGRRRARRGFTLIEAALVTVVIGTGVLGLLELLAAGTMSNDAGNEQTTGINLASNVREISTGLAFSDPTTPNQWSTKGTSPVTAYNDIKDLDGCTFQPPLDAARQPITNMGGWSQAVKVETIAEDTLASTRPNDPTAPAAKVTVRILHNGREVYRTRWIAAAPTPPP